MTKFKLNQIVIVNYRGTNQPALLLRRSVKNRRRVFDVRLENGVEIPYVTVDDPMSSIYIQSDLTKSIAHKISTNLSPNLQGNFKM